MHIHLPKTVHNWGELLVEIGVIVIGIVIALGGEQIVETLHWREQVEAGERALKPSFVRVVENNAEQEAQTDCIRARLDYLAAVIDKGAETGRLAPVGPIGGPPHKPWRIYVWEGLVAGQVASHMPREKLLAYSAIVYGAGYIADIQDQEQDQWLILSSLVGPGRRLSDAEAETLRLALTRARAISEKTLSSSRLAVSNIRDTGLLSAQDFAAAQSRALELRKAAEICQPMAPTAAG